MDVQGGVRALVEPLLAEAGMELIDIEYQSEQGTNVLRVYIDKSGGVTVDDLSNVSRELGTVLDVKELIHASYNLEVSSPGLRRPLTREKDFRDFAGKMVRLKTKEAVMGRMNFHAILNGLFDGKVLLTDMDGCDWEIELTNVQKANLNLELK